MHTKCIFTLVILILLYTSTSSFAQTLTSPSYSLINPKIAVSGGTAFSPGYSLDYVEVGYPFGTKMRSENYSLNTSPKARSGRFKPPVIIITSPIDGSIAYLPEIDVTGTVDGVPFTETKELNFGLNLLIIERGNGVYTSSKFVEVYAVRVPVELPQ